MAAARGRSVRWSLSWRADPAAKVFADRHYSRQNPESPQFVPPGRCVVLVSPFAFWITSAPLARYVKHAWPGAWVCSAFRNERREDRSSELIREALAATRAVMGDPPPRGPGVVRRREQGAAQARSGAVLPARGLPSRRRHEGRASRVPARRVGLPRGRGAGGVSTPVALRVSQDARRISSTRRWRALLFAASSQSRRFRFPSCS